MRELLYVTDPMCSWCWGFAEVLEQVRERLAPDIELRYLMGGLAPDSDEPMPQEIRSMVMGAWDAVEAATGARFNRDFWERCKPRRSTWPACRAVLAARLIQAEAGETMFAALQRAYYLEARNPSDRETALELAQELGLPVDEFARHLDSAAVAQALQSDLAEARGLGIRGFPSLALEQDAGHSIIMRGYQALPGVLDALQTAGALAP